MNDPDRVEFESRFSKPPFEWNFKRRGEESAWPVSYLNLEQEYAWQGFQMALEWERSNAAKKTELTDRHLALMDCQYMAGVKAGWNAANSGDPNAKMQAIERAYEGRLGPLRKEQS